jgi:hypothetical protein
MWHWMLTQIPGILIGFTVGAFTPSLGRKLKAMFVKEAGVIGSKIK